MKLLIDTNVLLDVLQEREPHLSESLKIWGCCEDNYIIGYISSMSLINISYIMRKELTPERMRETFMALALAFKFTDLNFSDLEKAADMKWRDYEDAVQSVTAERINADYIITRNTKDFQDSKVQALTPEEYFSDVFTFEE